MDFKELLEKYQELLVENSILKEEIKSLKAKYGVPEHQAVPEGNSEVISADISYPTPYSSSELFNHESEGQVLQSNVNSLSDPMNLLKGVGISMVFKSNIHQKFAVIDQKIVWYGSINLLSFGSAEESIMRLDSPNIANELIKSIDGKEERNERKV